MSRKDILDKINRRAKRIEYLKKNTRSKTYRQYVLEFLEKVDEVRLQDIDEIDFMVAIDSAATMLLARLSTIDHGVNAEVIWNNPDHYKDLRAVGVTIYWSKEYRVLYPDANPEEFVDVTELLFE